MSGWKKGLEVWPACYVSGGSFAIAQYLSSNFLGPLLPDIIASLCSIIATVAFLKVWHPKESWRFPDEPKERRQAELLFTVAVSFPCMGSVVILSLYVAAWGIKPVGAALNDLFFYKWTNAGVHNMVINYLGNRLRQCITSTS